MERFQAYGGFQRYIGEKKRRRICCSKGVGAKEEGREGRDGKESKEGEEGKGSCRDDFIAHGMMVLDRYPRVCTGAKNALGDGAIELCQCCTVLIVVPGCIFRKYVRMITYM